MILLKTQVPELCTEVLAWRRHTASCSHDVPAQGLSAEPYLKCQAARELLGISCGRAAGSGTEGEIQYCMILHCVDHARCLFDLVGSNVAGVCNHMHWIGIHTMHTQYSWPALVQAAPGEHPASAPVPQQQQQRVVPVGIW
jgi:hypothetical protein